MPTLFGEEPDLFASARPLLHRVPRPKCWVLAIAAAVPGGTSIFGGRGSLWAPIVGAVLITTVQNGVAIIDASPYAYPVITGAVILFAAVLDSIRSRLRLRLQRRLTRITVYATPPLRSAKGPA